jgi:hypothetical protein
VGHYVQWLDIDRERGGVRPVAWLEHDVAHQGGALAVMACADGVIALLLMAAPPTCLKMAKTQLALACCGNPSVPSMVTGAHRQPRAPHTAP